MHKLPQPAKLWYLSAFFRYERAQAGRYRQFWQIGAEAIGSDDPAVDAELITLLATLLDAAGVSGVRLRLASLGSPQGRAAYREELQGYLRANEDQLSDEVRGRIDLNPLRAFDADHPGTRAVMERAPRLLDSLEADDAEHFAEVRGMLDGAGVAYEIDPSLVRGLDYYTRTVFEFTSDALGAQSGVGGEGATTGSWSSSADRRRPAAAGPRASSASGSPPPSRPPRPRPSTCTSRSPTPPRGRPRSRVTAQARSASLATHQELAGRSVKGQLKQADRLRARYVAVVSPDGATVLRDLSAGTEEELNAGDVVVRILRERGMG